MVILDMSSSMAEQYNGQSKFKIAKDFLSAMNQTLPNMKLNGALRTYGHSSSVSKKLTTLFYGLTVYSSAGFEEALQAVKKAGGTSPLASAINAGNDDLKSTQGPIAIIVVSDGKDMDKAPMAAAKNMKKQFGGRICIYTVLTGNDPAGGKLMEQIAGAGECGFSVRADGFKSGADMADFVKKVFLAKHVDSDGDGVYDELDRCPNTPKGVKVDARGCPLDMDGDGVYDYLDKCPNTPSGLKVNSRGCPLDTDGDGVYDYLDKCPGTPKGAKINAQGCWILKTILFDTDKAHIKSRLHSDLNAVVTVLGKNPALKVEINGHTDNVGSAAYNMKLSEKRAKAVMEYLVSKGIDSKRLSTKGFGLTMPIADNDTPEGRAKNRRIELTLIQ